MDAKVFRMAILTIISAFILVLVIIYATNSDRINDMFGWGREKEASSESVSSETDPGEISQASEIIYGDQIGDSLDSFLLDDDFFDETEKIPSVMVRKQTTTVGGSTTGKSSSASQEEGEEENTGSGMAVVGQLINPNQELPVDSSGNLTSLPPVPESGFGEYIPAGQTVTGTAVGTP
ncbi:MAG: hypothetical protein IJU77_13730 [Butyrivibrio sp.]|nr:hypothetical protein [Butyrivibrio sp.]